jgi:two-component system, OmpR family, response regulator
VVADGDPHVRSILAEGLSAAGCEVATAVSGSELLAVARSVQPHIVLLDLLMPGVDGLEVLAILRSPNRSWRILASWCC